MNLSILDDIEAIKKLDSKNMLGSLELLAEQMKSIILESKKFKLPPAYRKARYIVAAGMGGSTLASHVIKNVFAPKLAVPFEICNGYRLPAYVGRQTLLIVSSYSGTTEEAVAMLEDARKRRALIVIIASGGVLAAAAEKYRIPAIVFSTDHNPCGSPRMGLGYSLAGQLAILGKAGCVSFTSADVLLSTRAVQRAAERWGLRVPASKNLAKQLASSLAGRSAWYVAAQHLVGSAHAGANQMNENAKRFAGYFAIPELNHHLMEGMLKPEENRQNLFFILFESMLYDKKIQKRFEITKSVLDKNGIAYGSVVLSEKKPLAQAAEALVFTSYTSYYAALAVGIDPTAIPFVDFFKEQLTK